MSSGAGAGVTFLGRGTGVKKVTPFTSALICEEKFFLRTSHPPKSAANFTLVKTALTKW